MLEALRGLATPALLAAATVYFLAWRFGESRRLAHIYSLGFSDPVLSYWSAFLMQIDLKRYKVGEVGTEEFQALTRASDDIVSSTEAVNEYLHARHTLRNDIIGDGIQVPLINTELTRSLGELVPEVNEEALAALDEMFPLEGNEWKSFLVSPALLQIFAKVANRVLVGLPLCRDASYIKTNVDFAVNVIVMSFLPPTTKVRVDGVDAAPDDDDEAQNDDKLTPEALTLLTEFFRTLVPPPQLHCVRCHKSYFDLENTDTSCRVPHDDDSTLVERVGVSSSAESATYQTLWGCCGGVGPPDGWCYEGMHTIDTRRARFRADSRLQDDKLVSCAARRCFKARREESESSDEERPVRAKRKRAVTLRSEEDARSVTSSRRGARKGEDEEAPKKKRRASRKPAEVDDDEQEVPKRKGRTAEDDEPPKRKRRAARKPISPEEVHDDDDDMDVEPQSPPATPRRSSRPPKSSAKARSQSRKPVSKLGNEIPRARSQSPVRSKLKNRLSVRDLGNETDTATPPVKRGRGRPRKNLVEVVDSSVMNEIEMT
ncbi:hypothetical protein D9611_000502 [Ephemerocybe angulata]|uniref:Uncharacterized protein n=1 Tax=Ephemerocybe angulata TaxID=980116 RepID=A0A8H5BMK6_9AGAR|nr:hypothetical protein D9611_000502 [Tulosesus angulatus]